MTAATQRLSRLLSMVPWLLRHQGVSLEETARHFGITQSQLVKDLELLFVCGTPGHMPDDLIEADWESGQVYLDNADTIARPLRLGLDEAIALLAGLQTLADVPGLHDRTVLESVRAKLAAATGEAAQASNAISLDLSWGAGERALSAARQALATHRRLRIRYLVASRDETTQRDVDPLRITSVDGRWYLQAWCHRAEAERTFRIDRIVDADVLDEAATPPPDAGQRHLTDALFEASPEDTLVTLDLDEAGAWVADYYPIEARRQAPDGRLRIDLRVATTDWIPRLAMRSAGAVTIAAPAELALRARELASAALAAYPTAGA